MNEVVIKKVIEVSNLTKKFGDFVAVDNISFDVKKGEIFGFLGANGAGKTTAMKILCGLSMPSDGQGSVAGFDINTQNEKIKQNIGYMSQKFSLYDDLKVWENMYFFGKIYGVKEKEIKQRIDMFLERFSLIEQKNEFVGKLPLGWKQKLAFCVANFHNPQIIFLDEPTGGVDPIVRRQFWELIYEAAQNGTSIFVTTHYMDEAEYCHRVSIMVDGKINALGTPSELKSQFGKQSMNDVFYHIAKNAKRSGV
ncbi:ABC transporter ATP-binding protein [Helicobacter japonicus]|uniref:ABC transporter ATP-binding protein n=3 Tax=Helicobacter japonicus TaxID=425400 RepID=A0A4U8TKF3_9HELI|nr:ABC transporter ATP-binding protein [Helicobacter japonicus]